MARPKLDINEDAIYDLAVRGWTNKEIAAYLGCSDDTLVRRFADTIKEGHLIRNGSLRGKQVELAMKGDRTMLIWLGKQLLGQSEKVEQSGEVTVKEAIERGKQYFASRSNGHPASSGSVSE